MFSIAITVLCFKKLKLRNESELTSQIAKSPLRNDLEENHQMSCNIRNIISIFVNCTNGIKTVPL